MCWHSSLEHDLYRRTSARPGRSLLGWLRDLWRPPVPQAEKAEVVTFGAEVPTHAEQDTERRRPRAA